MRDTWIDEHTGEETVPRSGFQADLRSTLAAELDAPAQRRTPWKAIGWASVAAAAAVATIVVATNNDGGRTVTPATDPTTEETTPDTGVPFRLRDRLIDVVWIVQTRNAEDLSTEFDGDLPSFTLQDVGRLVGFDGCNDYGFDTTDPGGWMLDGDVIRFDQAIVSTAMACANVPNAVLPVVDGTRVEFAQETGVLTLFHPDGTIYTATGSTAEPVEPDELVIPAAGGNPLSPTVISEVPIIDGSRPPLVALLPDRVVVLRFSDPQVLSFDRAGNPLPDTTIEAPLRENTGGIFGGLDGTLYVVENSTTENSQTVTAFGLVGGVWTASDSTIITENNDGVYNVTGEGLVLGSGIVLAAQTPDPSIPETGWIFGENVMQVFRNDTDGSTKLWDITEEFENFSIPTATQPFGDGVIYFGNVSGEADQHYIGVLRPNGASEYFRPGSWILVGADAETALFMQVTEGAVTLGVLHAG